MATCEQDSNSAMQNLTDETSLKTEQIAEDDAINACVVNTDGAAIQELTDGWQIDKKLGECMLQMFDARLWTDITFRCAGQSEENLDDRICAHKIVLAARSPVFQAMFFGPLKDSSEEIIIQDAEGGTFKNFLRLLYSDNVDLIDEFTELADSLEISHKYQVQFLIDGCCRKLSEKISVENACELLDRALLYDNQYLIDHTCAFIDRYAKEVLMTDGYLQMSSRCLTYLVKGDTFNANEADIFNRTIEWAKRRCESTEGQELRKTLGDAFYFLRTPNLTLSEFSACTKRKGFYSSEEQEDFMYLIDRVETSKIKTDCNYNRKRYSSELIMSRPQIPKSGTVKSRILSETISLFVHDNVYLSEMKLTNFTSAHHHHTVQYEGYTLPQRASGSVKCKSSMFKSTMITNDASSVLSLQNAPLVTTFQIDGELIPGKYTQISGDTPFTLTLNTPFRLCSSRTYTLQASIQLDAVMELQLQSDLCDGLDHFTCLRNDIIEAQTQSITNNAKLIQSLCFHCKSNRE